MTTDALDIYRGHLNSQMGEDGSMTEPALIDPSGVHEVEVFGIFDENTMHDNKDGGNVYQKNVVARFLLSVLPLAAETLRGLDVQLPYRDVTYNIDYVSIDAEGVQVLWLV